METWWFAIMTFINLFNLWGSLSSENISTSSSSKSFDLATISFFACQKVRFNLRFLKFLMIILSWQYFIVQFQVPRLRIFLQLDPYLFHLLEFVKKVFHGYFIKSAKRGLTLDRSGVKTIFDQVFVSYKIAFACHFDSHWDLNRTFLYLVRIVTCVFTLAMFIKCFFLWNS
jgi:hypothetical protein